MRNLPGISVSEWVVMRVIWDKSPRTANDVVGALEAETAWSPQTIKTLLNRLVKKKALGYEANGRIYHYYPLVQEEDCARAESRSFLERVYRGALTPMLSHFLELEKLSAEEIEELRRVLDEKGS
ncbi:MAG: BlaI/MecI/CopY family transcriptional regulator [Candidatus Hydrogenedentes bacterium]|nr:BlaI/MecI/CopY family transcriptional regulator [Candidatus Hydrogenedentota bacterium]